MAMVSCKFNGIVLRPIIVLIKVIVYASTNAYCRTTSPQFDLKLITVVRIGNEKQLAWPG